MDTERLKRFIIGLVVGLAIGTLLLIADASRPEKPDDIKLNDRGECVYPMSLSFVMGFAHLAALLGFVSYFTFQHGCCCKRRDGVSGSSFVLGIFLAIVSWSLVLCAAGPLYLVDVVAIWPGTRGKPPECYTYLKVDHHRIMTKAFHLSLFAITFGACSSKILSPPPIAAS